MPTPSACAGPAPPAASDAHGAEEQSPAGAEASGTAATSTGGVARQGVRASGHATLAPPKNRMGPTPHWRGRSRKDRQGRGAGPGTEPGAEGPGLGSRVKNWDDGQSLS